MENNKLFKIALLIGFITLLICIELPYSDKSIANILIPMIKIPSQGSVKSTIQLAGLLPLGGFLWSYVMIVKSKRFNASRFKIFFIMFIIILPIITSNLNVIRAPIYMLSSGVKNIEIVDSSLSGIYADQVQYIQVNVELKSYKNRLKNFQVGIELPDNIKEYVESTHIVFDEKIWLYRKQSYVFSEKIEIISDKSYPYNTDVFSKIYHSDYSIILLDSNSEVVNKRNDMY